MICSHLPLNLHETLPPLQAAVIVAQRLKSCFEAATLCHPVLHTNSQGVLANTAAAIKACPRSLRCTCTSILCPGRDIKYPN